MRIACIVGCRPNIVKAAPLVNELKYRGHDTIVIHTGQHWEDSMTTVFFEELDMRPDLDLAINNSVRSARLGLMVHGIGKALEGTNADACLVVGDVDSTLAGAHAAHTTGIPLIHLEAGLRSRDWTMPEESNRVITDMLSDFLLTTCSEAGPNLRAERVKGLISFVGNTMVDSLKSVLPTLEKPRGWPAHQYVLATFHRPALLDDPQAMRQLEKALVEIADIWPVLIPGHPRLARADFGISLIDPLPYREFLSLEAHARYVITDSGGVQEETTALNVPCFTYRWNTERPATVTSGTNTLVGVSPTKLLEEIAKLEDRDCWVRPSNLPYWDGKASERAADSIERWLCAF